MRCRTILLLPVLAAAVVGCGGDDDPPATASTDAAPPATEGAPEDAEAGDFCGRFPPEVLQPLLTAPLAPKSVADDGFCRYADTEGDTTNLELFHSDRKCEDFELQGYEFPGAFGYGNARVNQAGTTFGARLDDGTCLEIYMDSASGEGTYTSQLEPVVQLVMGELAG